MQMINKYNGSTWRAMVQTVLVFSLILFSWQVAAKAIPESSAEKVYVNYATAEQLAAYLPGIGTKKSKTIVEFRVDNGPFLSVEDLTKVKGLGVKTVEKFAMILDFDSPKSKKSKKEK